MRWPWWLRRDRFRYEVFVTDTGHRFRVTRRGRRLYAVEVWTPAREADGAYGYAIFRVIP